MDKSAYFMEHPSEGDRLEIKTDHALVLQQLKATGLADGMHALDVGAGTGAVTRDMAAIVGPRGSAVAFDRSAARLRKGQTLAESEKATNAKFVEGDIYEMPFKAKTFDYTWSRFVFEYLEHPVKALQQMVQVTKPGGRVVLADLDGNCWFHYPVAPEFQDDLNTLERALSGRFDPHVGRKLHHMMVNVGGLESIQVHAQPYHLVAGAISAEQLEHWRLKFESLRSAGEQVLGAPGYERFRLRFIDHLQAKDTLTYSTLFTVWGERTV